MKRSHLMLLCLLPAIIPSAVLSDKADRILRRQAGDVDRIHKAAAPDLDRETFELLLRSIARYTEPTRRALMETCAAMADDSTVDPVKKMESLLPPYLKTQQQAGQILLAFPGLAIRLGKIYQLSGEQLLLLLTDLNRGLRIIDRKAREAWIKRLRKSPEATSQLANAARFFREEFQHALEMREAYRQRIAAARDRAKEVERGLARVNSTTVVIVDQRDSMGFRYPTHDSRVVAYPYDSYSTYAWTRSTAVPYYGFIGDPYAGVKQLEREMIEVWQLPSYQVVQFILANADLFPDLAGEIVAMARRERTPETFGGSVKAWIAENQPVVNEDFLKAKGLRDRLAALSAASKKKVGAGVDEVCPPATGGAAAAPSASDGAVCPDPIFDRFLKPRADWSNRPTSIKDAELDQLEDRAGSRYRNMHGAIWATIDLQITRDAAGSAGSGTSPK